MNNLNRRFKMKYRGVECELIGRDEVKLSYNGKPLWDNEGNPLTVDAPHKIKGYIDCLIAIGWI